MIDDEHEPLCFGGAPIFTVDNPSTNYPPFIRNSPYWRAKTPEAKAEAFRQWQQEKIKMKIAFDLDGTAWEYQVAFKHMMVAFQSAGHQVGILTAHGPDLKDADLRLWAARGFAKPDFYMAKTSEEAGIPSREWKLSMVEKHSIDCLFDDFDTKEIRFIVRSKS